MVDKIFNTQEQDQILAMENNSDIQNPKSKDAVKVAAIQTLSSQVHMTLDQMQAANDTQMEMQATNNDKTATDNASNDSSSQSSESILQMILQFMEQFGNLNVTDGSGNDINKAISYILKFLQAIASVGNSSDPNVQKAMQDLAKIMNTTDPSMGGKSFGQYLVFFLVAAGYDQNGSAGVNQTLNEIEKMFGGATSSSNPFIEQILKQVQYYKNDSNAIYVDMRNAGLVSGDDDTPVSDFAQILEGNLDSYLTAGIYQNYKHATTDDLIEYLIEKYGKNPDLLLIMLLSGCCIPTIDNSQSQIGGMSGTFNGLSNSQSTFSNLITDLTSHTGKDGTKWDAKSAKDWCQQLFGICDLLENDSGRYGAIIDNLKQALAPITDKIQSAYDNGQYGKVAAWLNSQTQGKNPSSTISDALSSVSNILGNQSSSLQGQMQQVTTNSQQIMGSVQGGIQAIIDLNNYFTQHQVTS